MTEEEKKIIDNKNILDAQGDKLAALLRKRKEEILHSK